jgi:hypothetical protein
MKGTKLEVVKHGVTKTVAVIARQWQHSSHGALSRTAAICWSGRTEHCATDTVAVAEVGISPRTHANCHDLPSALAVPAAIALLPAATFSTQSAPAWPNTTATAACAPGNRALMWHEPARQGQH